MPPLITHKIASCTILFAVLRQQSGPVDIMYTPQQLQGGAILLSLLAAVSGPHTAWTSHNFVTPVESGCIVDGCDVEVEGVGTADCEYTALDPIMDTTLSGTLNLWPPSSPDLTTPDFFLWGYLKDRVYATRPQTLDDLKHNITQEIQANNRVLQRVASNMERRVELCLMQDGGIFNICYRGK
ncbi:uncharacterized protein [Periplaneta americana]|uniref:uncharacterized protein n=1 Tax=Periplaneta americana TaxID=6978 RepID=UPI0037E7C098